MATSFLHLEEIEISSGGAGRGGEAEGIVYDKDDSEEIKWF